MLEGKTAVIYGAGGSMGSAIAKALAAAGATVILTGRTLASVKTVADTIVASGGNAEAAQVDALDENAVNNHLEKLTANGRIIDISFNLIGYDVVQNIPMLEISVDDFTGPVNTGLRSQFITAKAAAKVMIKQGTGVILTLTATPGGIGYPYTGGFAPACAAIETLSKNLAAEIGIYGVRVVNIRSAGSPDSAVFKNAIEAEPVIMKQVLQTMEADTMLKRLPLMVEIANVAVLLASDMSSAITGVTIDVTCGTTAGLNYRANKE